MKNINVSLYALVYLFKSSHKHLLQFLDPDPSYLREVPTTMQRLVNALERAEKALKDYMDIYYDEKLMVWLCTLRERLLVRDTHQLSALTYYTLS